MNSRSSKVVAICVALVLPGSYASAQNSPLQGFDEYVAKTMKEWHVPGLSVAIVKDDKVVLCKGYGVRKLGETARVDAQTIFAIGSCTKAFTATALAMLGEDGRLKWDDPVVKHLPGFQLYDPYATRELTIRDLLCHRSGLERYDMLWFGSPLSRIELLQRLRFAKPSWSFRSKFGYQNLMYMAAGQIVPAVRLKSWDDFVLAQICSPLGMTNTNTSTNNLREKPNVAVPHERIDEKVETIPWRNIDNVAPAGSINSCAADMAQWIRLQLDEGSFDKKRIVGAAMIREMQSPQIVIPLEGVTAKYYPEAHFYAYGLGWFLSDYRGLKVVEHGGSIDGMRAQVALLPEKKLGLVVLSNLWANRLPPALMYRIFDAYLEAPARDWSAEFLRVSKEGDDKAKKAEEKQEAERISGTMPSLELGQYAASYRDDLYGEAQVSASSEGLKISFGPAYVGHLDHWHYDTFRIRWSNRTMGKSMATFRLDSHGKVEELSLILTGNTNVLLKRVASSPAKALARDGKN